MAWITAPAPTDDPALAQAVATVAGKRGKVSNIMKVHSTHPEVMLSHLRLYLDLMFAKSELTRTERELIAVAVSQANECAYCIAHHASSLRSLLRDDALAEAVTISPDTAPLSGRQRALVDYSLRLTRIPGSVSIDDVDALRRVGLGDRGIHDAASIAAYFNFVNRVALGLGVELEAEGWDANAPPVGLR